MPEIVRCQPTENDGGRPVKSLPPDAWDISLPIGYGILRPCPE